MFKTIIHTHSETLSMILCAGFRTHARALALRHEKSHMLGIVLLQLKKV